jgi:hypothetical protein
LVLSSIQEAQVYAEDTDADEDGSNQPNLVDVVHGLLKQEKKLKSH